MDPVKTATSSGEAGAARFGLRISIYNEVDATTTDLLFTAFPVRVGRNKLNELVLNHPYVSQWHAVIGLDSGVLLLTQVGSSNMVLVGDRKLRPNEAVRLTGDESIRITPFHLYLKMVSVPRSAPAPQRHDSTVVPAVAADQQVLERTALSTLDRISKRFVGINLQTPREIVSFGGQLELVLDIVLRYFVALQKGQEQFRQSLDIKGLETAGDNPVVEAQDAAALAAVLLSGRAAGAAEALEHAFKNIMIHQVALLNGLMAGVRTLLGKLGPKAIQKEAQASHRSPSFKVLWQTFERIHRDLAEEDNETFETIFGPQFGRAYTALVGKKVQRGK